LNDLLAAYIEEAIEVENRGLQIAAAPELVLLEELQQRLDADPALTTAFDALTPGAVANTTCTWRARSRPAHAMPGSTNTSGRSSPAGVCASDTSIAATAGSATVDE
jgi:hypothetical protein